MIQSPVPDSFTFCGRCFTQAELALIQQVVSEFGAVGINELSATVCELLEWKRPSGRLKVHEGRQLLDRLSQQGLIELPSLRACGPQGPRVVAATAAGDPGPETRGSAGQFEPLELERVAPDSSASRLWSQLVSRHHYLGYRVAFGASLRYLVRSAQCPGQVLACVLWSSAAWKMAARDLWIGWSPQQRARNLPYIVNNSRFLILPWVQVRGLASKILARCARQLPGDWQQSYGYRPLLLETLVDTSRFQGTCYRAANWIALGTTTGRGRMDRDHLAHGRAPKQIFVYPLCRQVQQRLLTASQPQFSPSAEED
jgi:Domain of unknown function (DUF4338)